MVVELRLGQNTVREQKLAIQGKASGFWCSGTRAYFIEQQIRTKEQCSKQRELT